MWTEIRTEQDIDSFMVQFNYFHDSCIKEIRYISGAYVDLDLSMHAVNDNRNLRMIIQRQDINPTTIELEFSGLLKLNLEPVGEQYSCELLENTMFIENELVYWGDSDGFASKRDNYHGTWLCSKKAKWRIADEYTGKEETYGLSKF